MIAQARRKTPQLIDTTLRDGEQAPGACFSPAQRRALAERLAEAGVDEIELGAPAMGPADRQSMAEILALALPCRATAWCRARQEDLDLAEAVGFDAIHLSFPTSEIHLGVLGWTPEAMLSRMMRLIQEARQRFQFVSIGAQDASRARLPLLRRFVEILFDAGGDRLRLADTVGVWHPAAVGQLVGDLATGWPELELGVHCHNDLGMATANSLAAVQAGASSVDVTVGGLGERAGNAALEQVAVALELCAEHPSGVRIDHLAPIARLVADWLDRPIPTSQPLTGSDVFRHESGIHVHGLLRDQRSYQPFDPQRLGRCTEFAVGRHSGRAGLAHALQRVGGVLDSEGLAALLERVRGLASRLGRDLTDAELRVEAERIHATAL